MTKFVANFIYVYFISVATIALKLKEFKKRVRLNIVERKNKTLILITNADTKANTS